MKKLIYGLLILSLLAIIMAPSADAGRKVKKTGSIEKGFYKDNKYSFEMKLSDDWNTKVNKEGDPFRFVMTQKEFAVPVDYQDAQDYTQVPTIALFVDTTSMNIGQFVDSLTSDSYSSEQKSEILKEFAILSEQELIPQDKSRFSIGEEKAYKWTARAMYTKEVATSASSLGGKRVKGSYGGAIVGFKKNDVIVLFHVICEYQYFSEIYNQLLGFANSVTFADSEG